MCVCCEFPPYYDDMTSQVAITRDSRIMELSCFTENSSLFFNGFTFVRRMAQELALATLKTTVMSARFLTES